MHRPVFELCGSVVTRGSVSCLAKSAESCVRFAHCNSNRPLKRLCRRVKHFWNILVTIGEELGLEMVGRLLSSETETLKMNFFFSLLPERFFYCLLSFFLSLLKAVLKS